MRIISSTDDDWYVQVHYSLYCGVPEWSPGVTRIVVFHRKRHGYHTELSTLGMCLEIFSNQIEGSQYLINVVVSHDDADQDNVFSNAELLP